MKVYKRNRGKRRRNKRKVDVRISRGVEALDRANNICVNCDNKASVVLAIVGVILAAILSEEGEGVVFKLVKSYLSMNSGFGDVVYRGVTLIALIASIIGVVLIVSVLFAQKKNEDIYSVVFFGDVAKFTSHEKYLDRLREMSDREYWIDLETQVYQVSRIAKSKCWRLNFGIIFLLIGVVAFTLGLVAKCYKWL